MVKPIHFPALRFFGETVMASGGDRSRQERNKDRLEMHARAFQKKKIKKGYNYWKQGRNGPAGKTINI